MNRFFSFFRVLQVSFLHVYHHASICVAWWAGLRLIPSGDSYFGALLNSTIHVLMYSYYTLSLLKINCPWKKYLTQCQLIQFVSVVLYSIYSTFQIPPGTHWTKYFSYLIQVFEMVSLFVFFSLFYKKAYNTKKPQSKISSSTSASSESKGELESISSVGTED
jgi:elongation of very long chain fatty acids protein 4